LETLFPAQQAIFAVVIGWCSNAEGYLKLGRLLMREQHRLRAVRPSAAGNNLPKKRGYCSFIPYPQKLWKTLWKTLWEA